MTSSAALAPALEVLGQRARPTTLAAERALPVLPALAPLLPDGALARGTTVGVAGPGATSLALGLVAAASAAGSWTVAVGLDDLGLAAAEEAGVALSRLVLVAAPPPDRWATVVAALVETIELVLVRPTGTIRAGDLRRLAAHQRTRGGVVVRVPGPGRWPEPADLVLRAEAPEWSGAVDPARLDGAGRLRSRRLVVEATGRRRAARPRRVDLWLPAPSGAVAPAPPAPGASPGASRGAPPAPAERRTPPTRPGRVRAGWPEARETWADAG